MEHNEINEVEAAALMEAEMQSPRYLIDLLDYGYANDICEYYKADDTVADAFRGQADYLEWHVERLRKIADILDEFDEECKFDPEDLFISGPSVVMERLLAEQLVTIVD